MFNEEGTLVDDMSAVGPVVEKELVIEPLCCSLLGFVTYSPTRLVYDIEAPSRSLYIFTYIPPDPKER